MFGLKTWALVVLAGMVIGAIVGIGLYISNAEEAKAEVVTLTAELGAQKARTAKAEENAKTNEDSFEECQDVNAENAKMADEQKKRADAAVLRLARLEGNTGRNVEVINREADKVRGKDTTCRTADEPLPEWIVAGLRQPTTTP